MCQHRHGPLICRVVSLGLVSVESRGWVFLGQSSRFLSQVQHRVWVSVGHMEDASGTFRLKVDKGSLSKKWGRSTAVNWV